MSIWIRRHWHTYWVANWNAEIDDARTEHDWTALDRAIDKRNWHEYRLALLRK